MSLLRLLSGVAFLAIVSVTIAAAPQSKPTSVTESVTVRGTVEAIDQVNRVVTLKGPKGNLVKLQADEKVPRFNDLKVGDVLAATYSESIAYSVRKPGEPEPEKERVVVRPGAKGTGASVSDYRTITVTIEEIDRSAQTVTVKGPEGNVQSFRVKDAKRLSGLNVGDKVDVTYTVALLLKAERITQ